MVTWDGLAVSDLDCHRWAGRNGTHSINFFYKKCFYDENDDGQNRRHDNDEDEKDDGQSRRHDDGQSRRHDDDDAATQHLNHLTVGRQTQRT